MATRIKRNNIPNRIVTHPYGYACKFCGEPGTRYMESLLTQRKEQIWFHETCFKKYVKECNA